MNIHQYNATIFGINLFSSFSIEELNKIFASSNYVVSEYEKGQIIHLHNDLCQSLDIILEGQVSVQKIEENGNTLIINTFSKRDIIGANLLFSSRNYYPMTISATTKATILHMRKELILDICQKDMNFLTNLMKIISDTTSILVDKIDMISLKTIRRCIIDFLKYEYQIQNSSRIKLNISKKDLAELENK